MAGLIIDLPSALPLGRVYYVAKIMGTDVSTTCAHDFRPVPSSLSKFKVD